MEKYKKFFRLSGILAVVMAVCAAASGGALLAGLGSGKFHTALLVLFLLSVALTVEMGVIVAYSKYYLSRAHAPARLSEAAHQDDLDREVLEARLAGFDIVQKNAVLLTKQDEKQRRRKAEDGVTFKMDPNEVLQGTAVGKVVGAFADGEPQGNPPHGDEPLSRTTEELFQRLQIESVTTTRSQGGGIVVAASVYNPGDCVVDGSLKADIFDFDGKFIGLANLVLPLNGIRPHQTVNLSGICAGKNIPYDTVRCLPVKLFGYPAEPASAPEA